MLKLLFAVFLVGSLAGGEALAGQRVRVAVYHNPPLMTYNAGDRSAGGIFMDVLKFTAAREGWDLELVPADAGQSHALLASGDVDLLSAIPYSRSREDRLSFTRETVATSWGRIYVRPRSSIEKLRDLSGRKVAILKGSLLQEKLLRDAAVPPELLEFPDFASAFRAVADGRAEAVMANRFTGAFYARELGLRPTSVVLEPYGFRFATRREPRVEHLIDALDRNLLLLRTDSESVYYRDLQELEDGARETLVPPWAYWGIAGALIVIVIAFAWALSARRAAARLVRSEAALRRALAELDRIGANSPDLIAMFDADFVVRRINPACEKLIGWRPEQVVGKSALDFVPPGRREQARHALEQVRSGACLQGHASKALRSDGTVVPVLWSLSWSDEAQELYAIGHDDTVRHELIANLSARTEQLQLLNRDLQTFAQSVSHDLRAPMAAVVGFVAKVLRDDAGALPERSRDLLARAHAAGERMEAIVANLLRLARVTEGGVRRRDCDVSAMCHDICAGLRAQDPARAVTLSLQPGMRAHADRDLLRHVFENLLANAWKFTARTAHAQIAVGCDEGRDGAVFFVSDNGAGFDMQHADRLFLPFGRLHDQREFSGVGIGLCVAHRVVTAHGGAIWAEGRPGEGAVFRFSVCARALASPLTVGCGAAEGQAQTAGTCPGEREPAQG